MKKFILVFISMLCLYQTSKSQSSDLIRNFNLATEEANKGHYATADSLFSLCVNESTNSDVFYNRSQVRRLLLDTCGFCKDLEIASDFFGDKEAENQYIKDCLNYIDTTFYSKENIKISATEKYRFYHVLRQPVCDTLTYVNFHDKKEKRLVAPVSLKNISAALKPETFYSDITGKAFLKDTVEIFYYIRDLSIDKIFEKSSSIIQDYSRFLDKRYKDLKVSRYELIHVHFKVTINENGKIIDVKFLNSDLNSENIESNDDLIFEISSFFKNNIVLDPIIFQNKKVFYETNYLFDF